VPYFHVVCTVPQEWREIIRRPQQDLYDILLRAAAQALIQLAADPHDVGGLSGGLGGLHTWTRTLAYHAPGHGLGPAGGVSADRTPWQPARRSSVVPVHALSPLFRGVLRALVRQARPDLTIPASVWTTGGVVDGQPAIHGPAPVLNYWGRDGHRLALPNSRRLTLEAGHVGFRYQDTPDPRWKTMTLPALACMRRLLPHVLPQGFHHVRDDGLWSPVHRPLRPHLQLWLAGHVPHPPPTAPTPERPATASWTPALRAGQPCPSGAQGLLVVIRSRPRPPRGPP
jgi:Putative transposase